MATDKKILDAIAADEALMDALEARIMAAAERFRRRLKRALESSLEGLMVDENGNLRPTTTNKMILNFSVGELERLLASNQEELIGELRTIFRSRLNTINRLAVNLGLPSGVFEDAIRNPLLVRRVEEAFAQLADGNEFTARALQREAFKLREGLGDGRTTRKKLLDTLQRKAGIAPQYAATLMRTELAGVDRTARIEQTRNAGLQYMRYTGPSDSLTRPWCAEHLERSNQIHSIHYWETANNGQINPPSLFGGGYNCRHRLLPWRPEWDAELAELNGIPLAA